MLTFKRKKYNYKKTVNRVCVKKKMLKLYLYWVKIKTCLVVLK